MQCYHDLQVLPENVEIYGFLQVCALVLFSRVCDRLDNAISRKGLNVCQAAYANKKYKSHRKVGLPSDIIASINAQNTSDPF